MHALSIKKEGIYRAYFAQELFLSNTFFQNSFIEEAIFSLLTKRWVGMKLKKSSLYQLHLPLCGPYRV